MEGSNSGLGIGVSGQNLGLGRAASFFVNNTANNESALVASTNSTGTGEAARFTSLGAANTGAAMTVTHQGDGPALVANNTGTNTAVQIGVTNPDNSNVALTVTTAGEGRAAEFLSNNFVPTLAVGQEGQGAAAVFLKNAETGTVPTLIVNQFSTSEDVGASAITASSASLIAGSFNSQLRSSLAKALVGVYSGGGAVDAVGVYGQAITDSGFGYGVYGEGNRYGVFAQGELGASGTKTFMIDHPLDPENKYLRHFSVESPEILNMYRGNVVLDAADAATVVLPDYFEAINTEFTYQLTAIGAPARDLHVQYEIEGNTFAIAGGIAGMKVSWVVYAQRNDPYVRQTEGAREVELDKRPEERGKYLMPRLYGAPDSMGVMYRPTEPGQQ